MATKRGRSRVHTRIGKPISKLSVKTTIVSIGHRASLEQFHARRIEWRVKEAAAGELAPS